MAAERVIHKERNQEATIYVGGLSGEVDDQIVHEAFSQFGKVHEVHMPKDRTTSRHQGFGFIEFKAEEAAHKAVEAMHAQEFHGKQLRVNMASSGSPNKNKERFNRNFYTIPTNLFVTNLAPEVDEKMLGEVFDQFSPIHKSIKVMRDQETGDSRGFGFVNFTNVTDCDLAMSTLDGQLVGGQKMNIKLATKRKPKPQTSTGFGLFNTRMAPPAQPGYLRNHDDNNGNRREHRQSQPQHPRGQQQPRNHQQNQQLSPSKQKSPTNGSGAPLVINPQQYGPNNGAPQGFANFSSQQMPQQAQYQQQQAIYTYPPVTAEDYMFLNNPINWQMWQQNQQMIAMGCGAQQGQLSPDYPPQMAYFGYPTTPEEAYQMQLFFQSQWIQQQHQQQLAQQAPPSSNHV